MVSFPNLNLSFNINPVAIDFGNIKIYWYGILIFLAIVISLIVLKKDDGKYNIKFNDVYDFSFGAIIIGIFCARLYYVLFNIEYYSKNIIEVFKINKRRSCNLWCSYWRNNIWNILLQKEKNKIS